MRYWWEWFPTSDFAGSAPRVISPVDFDRDYHINAIRTWVMIHGSPVFSSLQMRVYSRIGDTIGNLLHTSSNSWTLAQLTDEAYAAREVYFTFDNPIPIKADRYMFALWANGYTGTEESCLGWIKAFPEPIYTAGLTINPTKIGVLPFKIGFIGDKA